MSAQTHEERLREMARLEFPDLTFDTTEQAARDAGATALAITREIAELEGSPWEDTVRLLALLRRCVELHARR